MLKNPWDDDDGDDGDTLMRDQVAALPALHTDRHVIANFSPPHWALRLFADAFLEGQIPTPRYFRRTCPFLGSRLGFVIVGAYMPRVHTTWWLAADIGTAVGCVGFRNLRYALLHEGFRRSFAHRFVLQVRTDGFVRSGRGCRTEFSAGNGVSLDRAKRGAAGGCQRC
jgi:hypothetical protein